MNEKMWVKLKRNIAGQAETEVSSEDSPGFENNLLSVLVVDLISHTGVYEEGALKAIDPISLESLESSDRRSLQEYYSQLMTTFNRVRTWDDLIDSLVISSETISPSPYLTDPLLNADPIDIIKRNFLKEVSEILNQHFEKIKILVKNSFSANDIHFKLLLFSAQEIIDQVKGHLSTGNFRDEHLKFYENLVLMLNDNIQDYERQGSRIEPSGNVTRIKHSSMGKYWFSKLENGKFVKIDRRCDINYQIMNWIDEHILVTCPTLILQKETQKSLLKSMILEFRDSMQLPTSRIDFALTHKCTGLNHINKVNKNPLRSENKTSTALIKLIQTAFKVFGKDDESKRMNSDSDINKWIHAVFWKVEGFKFETIRKSHLRKTLD